MNKLVLALGLLASSVALADGEGDLSLDDLGASPPPATDAAATPAEGADASATTDGAASDAGAAEETPADAPASGETATDEGINLTLQDRIKAVSRKTFLKTGRFELDPQLAVTVNDPFFRTWAPSLRGAWHLDDAFALELGGGYVPPFFVEKLEPVDFLRETIRLVNTDNKLGGYLDAGLTFSPLYGKFALFGDAIVLFDGYVGAGLGAMVESGVSLDNFTQAVHPAMNVSVGTRIFMTRWLVLRADLRDALYPQDETNISTLQNVMFVNLGLGFFFPFDFEYRYEAARVNSNG